MMPQPVSVRKDEKSTDAQEVQPKSKERKLFALC